ncbi:hypothetical protein ACFUYE_02555 [Micromonospora humida]|uniref:hypothetical protein n=1 Tax=Micromonospora humida TaxID=2809018 RepID=UPI00366B6A02
MLAIVASQAIIWMISIAARHTLRRRLRPNDGSVLVEPLGSPGALMFHLLDRRIGTKGGRLPSSMAATERRAVYLR